MSGPARIEAVGAPAAAPSGPSPGQRAMWIGQSRPTFAIYHEPAVVDPRRIAVLFCAPFGWEDMGSYPIRRLWAQRLARSGHPVLRFDLPGSGQSGGGPGEEGQLRHWVAAVDQCARWLAGTSGSDAVVAIGIGMGALLALRASAEGAPLDELVLWGLPRSGRALVRRMRAFAKLQLQTQATEDLALPPGWVQSGGYMLSDRTVDELGALRINGAPGDRLRRVLLLLEQSSEAGQDGLARWLGSAGVQLDVEEGEGFAAMFDSPHLSEVPDHTIAVVDRWLAAQRPRSRAVSPGAETPLATEEIELEIDGALVQERPYAVQGPDGSMFGILTTLAGSQPVDGQTCVICLPAFAERCIGPSRMWVEIARRHAARGVPVLRIDLESIGDSDGCPEDMRAPNAIHDPDRVAQVRRVMDALQQREKCSRFLLVGLCAGGYWAQATAACDARVAGVLALNPSTSPQARNVLRRAAALRVFVIFSPSWWGRVMRGEVSSKGFKTVRRGLRYGVSAVLRRLRRREAGSGAERVDTQDPFAFTYRSLTASLEDRGGRMICAMCRSEHAYRTIEIEGLADEAQRPPGFKLLRLDHDDHNLRSASDQQAVHVLTDELIETDAHCQHSAPKVNAGSRESVCANR